jgi:transcriptional regulator with XRE-family HTH domain
MDVAVKIKTVLMHKKMTIEEMAKLFGLSRVSFSRRLSRGNFNSNDLLKIAKIIGAKYKHYFEFPDGTKI